MLVQFQVFGKAACWPALSRDSVEMQISRVEICDSGELVEIEDADRSFSSFDISFICKTFERSVDMNIGQRQSVS